MVLTSESTGEEILSALVESGLGKHEFWRQNLQDILTYDAMHGRMWRFEHGMPDYSHLMAQEFPKPWTFEPGHYMVLGDVQLSTSDYDFMALPLAVGVEYMRKPRKLIVAGDLINADAFSNYESDTATPSLTDETEAGWIFFQEYLTVFQEIYWFLGNHERRVGKRTKGAIQPNHLLKMLTHDKRVKISQWGHAVVTNLNGIDWRVTHASNYSINQLVVAEAMALKFEQNIISHHEHHLAVGYDRYKRYMLINNGGLFRQSTMGYTQWDDSKSAGMQQGFTRLDNGYPTVYGPDGFTNWDMVLPMKAQRKVAA